MKKLIWLVLLLLVLPGCSTVNEVLKDKASYITNTVCKLSPAERTVLRQEIDALTAPNKIRIECGEE